MSDRLRDPGTGSCWPKAWLAERRFDLADGCTVLVGPLEAAVHRVDRDVGCAEPLPLFVGLAPLVRGASASIDTCLNAVCRPPLAGCLPPCLHPLQGTRPTPFQRTLREEPVCYHSRALEGRFGGPTDPDRDRALDRQ